HPLLPGHQGDASEVVQRGDLIWSDARVAKTLRLPGHLPVDPLDEIAELTDLQRVQLVPAHRFVTRVPVRRLVHGAIVAQQCGRMVYGCRAHRLPADRGSRGLAPRGPPSGRFRSQAGLRHWGTRAGEP